MALARKWNVGTLVSNIRRANSQLSQANVVELIGESEGSHRVTLERDSVCECQNGSGLMCIGRSVIGILLAMFTLIVTSTSIAAQTKTLNIHFKSDQGDQETLGEVVVEDAKGNLLLLTPDGQLWTLLAEDVVSREETDEEMQPLTSEEIYAQFKSSMPSGVQIHKTKHYVMLHNTNPAYAAWVGELFERLYRGFYNYWKSQRVELEQPRFPLVAFVFSDKNSYMQFAEREVGESAKAMIGYYNLKTNRMITCDLTGINGIVPQGTRLANSRMINQILSQPQAERTVATIVHEAVHQIAYNSGLQVRLADNPRWLSEGMAMFFESPDFKSSRGWSMGKVNYHNLRGFAQYLPQRGADSLTSLISDDERLLSSETARTAYPESWALTYFLMKTKKVEYSAYLQELATKRPLESDKPRDRVELFKKHFGEDLEQLDQDFIKYIRTVQ